MEGEDWIHDVTEETGRIANMSEPVVTLEDLERVIRKTHSWKAAGPDKVQNYWHKRVTCLHPMMCKLFNGLIREPKGLPKFMTKAYTYLKPKRGDTKDPSKYRPITCLSTIYKIFTACIAGKVREHCEKYNIIAEEQKGCRRGAMGCKEQLVIDQVITEQAYRRKRNITTAFIDYQKAYDSVPHSWLRRVLQIYKIHPAISECLSVMMTTWRTEIQINTEQEVIKTNEIKICCGIFQGDTFSPLWFCLAMNPLSATLNKHNEYGISLKMTSKESISVTHLLYMDDLKSYGRTEEKLRRLVVIAKNFSDNIKMKFGIDKCRIQNVNGDKQMLKENTEEEIPWMEPEETYKYLKYEQRHRIEHRKIIGELQKKFLARA